MIPFIQSSNGRPVTVWRTWSIQTHTDTAAALVQHRERDQSWEKRRERERGRAGRVGSTEGRLQIFESSTSLFLLLRFLLLLLLLLTDLCFKAVGLIDGVDLSDRRRHTHTHRRHVMELKESSWEQIRSGGLWKKAVSCILLLITTCINNLPHLAAIHPPA